MSLLGAWKGVAKQIAVANAGVSRMKRRISDAADEAENLEQAMPSAPVILGPDGMPAGGGGGPRAQYPAGSFFASSVAPAGPTTLGGSTPGGMPNLAGRSMTLGGGKSSGGAESTSGGAKGIKSPETNRDKIGAIVEAAGVSPPPADSWNENGTGPGEFPGFIIQTVLSLGTSAPLRFLVWCAGWLAYSAVATQAMRGSKGVPNRSRHGGSGPREWAEWRKNNPYSTLAPWDALNGTEAAGWINIGGGGGGGGGGDLGFGTSGGGGGEAWAKSLPGGGSWNGGGSDNSGGSWEGDSAFDTLTASTSKAVTEGVTKAQTPVVDGINKMVDQMTKLNASLQSDGGLRYRTGGVS